MGTDVIPFIKDSFCSVWALELLIFLQRSRHRAWQPDELVGEMRASRLVVDRSVATLVAVGFVLEDEHKSVRYRPATDALEDMACKVADLYRSQPSQVRRAIVSRYNIQLDLLANAFRLKQ